MGKCLSRSCKKSLPNLVFREAEKGGLYQRIFFFTFCFDFTAGILAALLIRGWAIVCH